MRLKEECSCDVWRKPEVLMNIVYLLVKTRGKISLGRPRLR